MISALKSESRLLTVEDVCRLPVESTVAWVTPSVKGRVSALLPFTICEPFSQLSQQVLNLIIVGGGTLIDEAKVWRLENALEVKLFVIPSIWGSGAEVSPVAVLNRNNKKVIRKSDLLLPDGYAYWPDLTETLLPSMVRNACGDVWTHAVEGFWSPLANDDLRKGLGLLMTRMAKMPIANDPQWFECSAMACFGQAKAGVGLVHGIAHTLEGKIVDLRNPDRWGHARLCALFLWPVMEYNMQMSPSLRDAMRQYGVVPEGVLQIARSLFDEGAYQNVLPVFNELWPMIIRDPCTRINPAIVRLSSLEYFVKQSFRETP